MLTVHNVNLMNRLALICCENSALKQDVKWCVLKPLMARMNSSRKVFKVLARTFLPFDLSTHSHRENAKIEERAMTTLFKDRLGSRSPMPKIPV